jgi:cytochrome c oxidase subunit 2
MENKMNKALLVFALALAIVPKAAPADGDHAQTIEIHARRFSFQPDVIHIKKGETVRLRLISDDVPHSLQVKELGINELATRKKPGEATFTASNSGIFHGQCGRFCGEGHGRMKFTIAVDGN